VVKCHLARPLRSSVDFVRRSHLRQDPLSSAGGGRKGVVRDRKGTGRGKNPGPPPSRLLPIGTNWLSWKAAGGGIITRRDKKGTSIGRGTPAGLQANAGEMMFRAHRGIIPRRGAGRAPPTVPEGLGGTLCSAVDLNPPVKLDKKWPRPRLIVTERWGGGPDSACASNRTRTGSCVTKICRSKTCAKTLGEGISGGIATPNGQASLVDSGLKVTALFGNVVGEVVLRVLFPHFNQVSRRVAGAPPPCRVV